MVGTRQVSPLLDHANEAVGRGALGCTCAVHKAGERIVCVWIAGFMGALDCICCLRRGGSEDRRAWRRSCAKWRRRQSGLHRPPTGSVGSRLPWWLVGAAATAWNCPQGGREGGGNVMLCVSRWRLRAVVVYGTRHSIGLAAQATVPDEWWANAPGCTESEYTQYISLIITAQVRGPESHAGHAPTPSGGCFRTGSIGLHHHTQLQTPQGPAASPGSRLATVSGPHRTDLRTCLLSWRAPVPKLGGGTVVPSMRTYAWAPPGPCIHLAFCLATAHFHTTLSQSQRPS